jgi:hypothetical protein
LRKTNRWAGGGLTFLLVGLTLAACWGSGAEPLPPTGAPVIAAIKEWRPAWTPIFKGVDFAQVRKLPPDPLAVYAVRIDLREPTIKFVVTPSNGDRPLETDAKKTSTFLKESHCQVAVNASPFSPVEEKEGEPRDILGISASRGDVYSQPHGNHAAMFITKDNAVTFGQPPADLSTVYNAVSGFIMIVENGQIVATDEVRHPRTVAGTSQDGRHLYLMEIDGRQPDYSAGAGTKEAAEWILQLGAYTALNLDGGGSTALVIDDGQGGAKVLNRPIHNKVPGTERANGNSLGVFAQSLDKK